LATVGDDVPGLVGAPDVDPLGVEVAEPLDFGVVVGVDFGVLLLDGASRRFA
jgi:hypothetical protein